MNKTRSEYETVLLKVRRWPPDQRVALIQDVLGTLVPQPDQTPSSRRNTLSRALGLLATNNTTPTDEEVEKWLAEHRVEKYG